jgi:hypothetical protein
MILAQRNFANCTPGIGSNSKCFGANGAESYAFAAPTGCLWEVFS